MFGMAFKPGAGSGTVASMVEASSDGALPIRQ